MFDSRNFIKTEWKNHKNMLDSELTNKLVKDTFEDLHVYHSFQDLFHETEILMKLPI